MNPLRGALWACALVLWGAAAAPVHAAWSNVFQVCCSSCGGGAPVVSGYAPDAGCNSCPQPACNPCPQPVCTTRYVQRCYYQPVTCYQTRTYYEPVTTYRTSYYYEPVTSYRYSCYYDACSCSYQQVACPTTCYQLRSQCCPVQSWAQRCCQVPVTSYQQAFYYEPVTTCCTPPPAPSCCPTSYSVPAAQAVVQAPSVAQPAPVPVPVPVPVPAPAAPAYTPAPPAVSEQGAVPVPGVKEYPAPSPGSTGTTPQYDRYYPQPQTATTPPTSGTVRPVVPAPLPAAPAPRPPAVRLDRIVSGPAGLLRGQVVSNENAPRAGARVMFVNAARQGQQIVTTDSTGKFRVTLASGGWLVYVKGADQTPVFYSKIDVRDNETRQFTLVSR